MATITSRAGHRPLLVAVKNSSYRLSPQKRLISNYLYDVFRSGSLRPTNPILETFDQIYPRRDNSLSPTETSTSVESSSDFKKSIPQFSLWQPHHLQEAGQTLQEQHSKDIAKLKEKLLSSNPKTLEVVSDWDRIHSPAKYLHNAAFVLGLLSDPSLHNDWKRALGELSKSLPNPMNEALLDQYEDEELLALFHSFLKEALGELDDDSRNAAKKDWLWAAKHWERAIRQSTGMGLSTTDQEKFRNNLDTVEALEGRMLANNNPTKEQLAQILSDGYSIIDLRRQNAQLLGYDGFAEQVLEARMANSVSEVQSAHESVAERLLPVVENLPDDPFDAQYFKPGEICNPTFDGALIALRKIVKELFGVEIRREQDQKERNLSVWNKDVWLLHCFDHENKHQDGEPRYLGSVFLDPFRRSAKMRQPFLAPLVDRGPNNEPLVAISLDITPPVWDDQPAEINWGDVENMYHEFGHAIQLILAQSTLGGVCGGHNLPLDISEVTPKFMEHCLFAESMMTTIMECSETGHTLTPEMVEKLMMWRNHRKAKQIMQHVFFGSLELELFSTFDPTGEESLVGLQRRVATQYTPHDMPSQKDLSPFLEVMAQNARGTNIGFYRYFWSEIYSAGLFQAMPNDISNGSTDSIQKEGAIFRREFLEPGALLDPTKAFRPFEDENGGAPVNAMLDLFNVPRS